MISDPVIWQSKFFPRLVLTRSHLEILKYAYPQIKHFEPYLREAEAWLYSNPARRPKSNYKRFITNWMRNVVKFDGQQKPEYGDAARRTPGDPKLISDIMKKCQ